jgi:hypothetical protein
MTRVLVIVAVGILLGSKLAANEPGLPGLTKETLIGTWEGVSPHNPFVFRLEITASGPSYLVWTWDGHPIMLRLVSTKVRNGHIVLRFLPMRGNDISFDDVTISGSGYGDATLGVLTGTLRIKKPMDKDYTEAIGLRKPAWVPWLPEYAKRSKDLMRRARREVK